ncbi:hypothetical protein GLOIN_2v1763493 [Rhizophagus irregularis DAOM 181602=DAOM 197198]|nr:hypothetical protein GLOIN_2v1763493 [Rhizophagus irregularis DAOM 181602=DAOM 197198]
MGSISYLLEHRQSGKTTIAMGLKRWLEDNSSYVVYYLNFNTGITTKKDIYEFWRSNLRKRSVCSIVLIGTEIIKEFLLPSSRNISPLSAGQEFYTTRFTSEEIKNLFTQYVEENKLNVDVDEIVADIYSLTLGHKDLNENEIEILTEVLYHGTKQLLEDIKNKKDVQFLLAEGIIVKVPHTNYEWMIIECAAPILRNIMLSRIHRPTIKHSSPIDTTNIDPEWLLARTIENMSIQDISHKYTFNANNQPRPIHILIIMFFLRLESMMKKVNVTSV